MLSDITLHLNLQGQKTKKKRTNVSIFFNMHLVSNLMICKNEGSYLNLENV